MGRPPAYIFIVRHGNRLDAADKLWHLSSPTPYDPPLTYGGWSQSRAIGQRIADILRESTPPESAPPADGKPAPKKRRYKIVIHSSPFLRCIQTSIAISSGIASDSLPLEHPRSFEPLPPLRIRTPIQNGQSSAPTSNPSFDSTPKTITPRLNKSVMRLDAFLGEWLSPGYFELITPPPSSVLMVASAKAELLRREDYSTFSNTTNHQAVHAHSHSASYLWGATRSNSWTSRPSEGEELPRSGSQHIPPVEPPIGLFTNTSADGRPMSSNGDIQSPRWDASGHAGMHRPNLVGYVAPVPQFAMSSRAPTPSGYVAHARDACVDFDYQWDSMRAPYDWGDGGEFGEEWAAMHRRFRKGLQKLVDWYSITDAPAKMVTNAVQFRAGSSILESSGSCSEDADCAIDDNDSDSDTVDDDCIEETVVVLVSHGAGCNALIGAITQQPVLMDVGLASLSVAVRRPGMNSLISFSDDEHSHTHNSKWSGAIHSGHPDGIVPLNKYFEMKLLANSDHLRSVPTTPTTPRGSMASVIGGTRGRHSNSLSGTPGNFNLFESGVVGHRSSSAGHFHGGADFVTRRPSGASSRPPLIKNPGGSAARSGSTNGRGSSGITIGSGVLTFSPPTIKTTSRMSHSRPDSVGLWSPASSTKDPDEDNFDFSLTDEGDSKDDDDMEILLSFGPESPKSPPQPEKKKKAPSIRGISNPIYPSSLSIAHSADGDHDDHSERTGDSLKGGYKGMSSALPRLDTRGPTSAPSTDYGAELVSADTFTPPTTSTTARAASPSSPSLWIHPRVVSLNSDELPHEMATSKRRWTVTEPPV